MSLKALFTYCIKDSLHDNKPNWDFLLSSKPNKKSAMAGIILYESLSISEAINYHWMDGLIDIYEDLLHKVFA